MCMTRRYLLLYRSRCSTDYSIVRYLITNPAASTLEICTLKAHYDLFQNHRRYFRNRRRSGDFGALCQKDHNTSLNLRVLVYSTCEYSDRSLYTALYCYSQGTILNLVQQCTQLTAVLSAKNSKH